MPKQNYLCIQKSLPGGKSEKPSPAQMQEMLDRYLNNHKQADPPPFDPAKVKNVIIAPKDLSEKLP